MPPLNSSLPKFFSMKNVDNTRCIAAITLINNHLLVVLAHLPYRPLRSPWGKAYKKAYNHL